MDKIWFILIEESQEGPYSIFDLKRDARITPDTYVWKEGFPKWVRMRAVPELKEVFKDEKQPSRPKSNDEVIKPNVTGREELTLDFRRDLPPLLLWFFILLVVLSYLLNRLSI